jgi:hypothetical protein
VSCFGAIPTDNSRVVLSQSRFPESVSSRTAHRRRSSRRQVHQHLRAAAAECVVRNGATLSARTLECPTTSIGISSRNNIARPSDRVRER